MGNDVDRTVESLWHDLLRFVADGHTTYAEVMEAWRTSCPRLPIWEEAVERGLLVRARDESAVPTVQITEAGGAFLTASSAGPGTPSRPLAASSDLAH